MHWASSRSVKRAATRASSAATRLSSLTVSCHLEKHHHICAAAMRRSIRPISAPLRRDSSAHAAQDEKALATAACRMRRISFVHTSRCRLCSDVTSTHWPNTAASSRSVKRAATRAISAATRLSSLTVSCHIVKHLDIF